MIVELNDVYGLLVQVNTKLDAMVKEQEVTSAIASNRANTVELATDAVKRDPQLSFALEGDEIVFTRQTAFGPQIWRQKVQK